MKYAMKFAPKSINWSIGCSAVQLLLWAEFKMGLLCFGENGNESITLFLWKLLLPLCLTPHRHILGGFVICDPPHCILEILPGNNVRGLGIYMFSCDSHPSRLNIDRSGWQKWILLSLQQIVSLSTYIRLSVPRIAQVHMCKWEWSERWCRWTKRVGDIDDRLVVSQ